MVARSFETHKSDFMPTGLFVGFQRDELLQGNAELKDVMQAALGRLAEEVDVVKTQTEETRRLVRQMQDAIGLGATNGPRASPPFSQSEV